MQRMRSLALALAVLPLAGCGGQSEPGADAPAQVAARKAPIEIVDLAGLDAALARYRGRGVLLNFWAIWCVPCVEELPELIEAAHAFEGRDAVVLGVSYDLMVPTADKARIVGQMQKFTAARGMDIPVLVYDAPDFEAINERFQLPGEIPVTLALDRDGNVVDRHEGRAGRERFEEMLSKALGG